MSVRYRRHPRRARSSNASRRHRGRAGWSCAVCPRFVCFPPQMGVLPLVTYYNQSPGRRTSGGPGVRNPGREARCRVRQSAMVRCRPLRPLCWVRVELCASVVLLTRLFNRTGAGKEELDRAKSEFVSRWGEMSVTQRVGDWASRHRYQLFFGCWAGSMAASWLLLRGNKTQSFSQKVRPARARPFRTDIDMFHYYSDCASPCICTRNHPCIPPWRRITVAHAKSKQGQGGHRRPFMGSLGEYISLR